MLFAVDSPSTWSDYGILFDHWSARGLASRIRDRLSMVSALTPERGTEGYLERFRENAWNLFRDRLYDSLSGPDDPAGAVSYDLSSEESAAQPFGDSVESGPRGWHFPPTPGRNSRRPSLLTVPPKVRPTARRSCRHNETVPAGRRGQGPRYSIRGIAHCRYRYGRHRDASHRVERASGGNKSRPPSQARGIVPPRRRTGKLWIPTSCW